MEKIKEKYLQQINKKSDINEHIETLYNLSKECSHITEMGVRAVSSTWSFLYSKPQKLISYDIYRHEKISEVESLSKEYGIDFTFITQDVLTADIEPTELLFIDTLHTYNQLINELSIHAKKSSKYIVLHDTVSFGFKDETIYSHASELIKFQERTKVGLVSAVNDFLETEEGTKWVIHKEYTNNNGLMILRRKKVLITTATIGGICQTKYSDQEGYDVTYKALDMRNFPTREKVMSSRLVSKIAKMLSWDLYPGYDIYVWIDDIIDFSNKNSLDWIIKKMGDSDTLFFKHPHGRTTIKEEAEFLLSERKKGKKQVIDKCHGEDIENQLNHYLSDETFVDDLLIATGVFAYKSKVVQNREYNLMKEWFYNLCRWNVRDQVSLPYLIKKFGISYTLVEQDIYKFDKIVTDTLDSIEETTIRVKPPKLIQEPLPSENVSDNFKLISERINKSMSVKKSNYQKYK